MGVLRDLFFFFNPWTCYFPYSCLCWKRVIIEGSQAANNPFFHCFFLHSHDQAGQSTKKKIDIF
jgi:hypothetical protein